jgi:hypothetical protein
VTRLTAPAPIVNLGPALMGYPRFTVFRQRHSPFYLIVDDATRREYASWTLRGARRIAAKVAVQGMPAWGGRPAGSAERGPFVEEVDL